MKVIAAVLCLVAAANAAAVLPLESSVVKSDRVGDNFSYSIHQNQGYAALTSDLGAIKPLVPADTYVSPLATQYKQVLPVSPLEIKATEYKHILPVSPLEIKETEYKHVVPAATYVSAEPIKNVELKSYVQPTYVASPVKSYVQPTYVASPLKSYVQPTYVASPLKSYVQPTYVASPFKSYAQPTYVASPVKSYVQPAATVVTSPLKDVSYVSPITYTHDAAVPFTYGADVYPYSPYTYPITHKVY